MTSITHARRTPALPISVPVRAQDLEAEQRQDAWAMDVMAERWRELAQQYAPERLWLPRQWWWVSRLLRRPGSSERLWRVRDVAGKSRPVFMDERGNYLLGTIRPGNLSESGVRDFITMTSWIAMFALGGGIFTVPLPVVYKIWMGVFCILSGVLSLTVILMGEARREAALIRMHPYKGQEVTRRTLANAMANMIERMERGETIDVPRLEDVRWRGAVEKIRQENTEQA